MEPSEGRYPIVRERRRRGVSAFGGSDQAVVFNGEAIALADHLKAVGERAAGYALRMGMPPGIVDDMRLAGQLHDIGLADPRCQLALVGNDPVESEWRRGNGLLAKSLRWVVPSGPLPGTPHPMVAVSLVESNPKVLASAHDPDLVLHLIATHHGYGRPISMIATDTDSQVVRYFHGEHEMETSTNLVGTGLILEGAERFWKLIAHYGHHDLAWLETIFRMAEHRQSASESGR